MNQLSLAFRPERYERPHLRCEANSLNLPPGSEVSSPLCKNCSETVLSYIIRIQEILDNLYKKIYFNNNATDKEILRQDSCNTNTLKEIILKNPDNSNTIASTDASLQNEIKTHQNIDNNEVEINSNENNITPKPTRKLSKRRNSRRLSKEQKTVDKDPPRMTANESNWKMDFLYNVSPSAYSIKTLRQQSNELKKQSIIILGYDLPSPEKVRNYEKSKNEENCSSDEENYFTPPSEMNFFEKPLLDQPEALLVQVSNALLEIGKGDAASICNQYDAIETEACISNIVNVSVKEQSSLLSNIEKTSFVGAPKKHDTIYEKSTNVCFQNQHEAFVTICRNDVEALGCLVVGSSLLLCRTSKTLCILVFDGVSNKLEELLSSVFHVIKHVAALEPCYSAAEGFWNEPTVKTPFEKLNVWRLTQFRKCVYLNPDTLVMQNCDELFDYDELSAVPDIGWPDCFNSGVFVFSPSATTFLQMVKMLQQKGYNDGNEQMFLNSFFSSWPCNLSNKLSFIYNLNLLANATYTYSPAFYRFHQNVKIVQFAGFFKPWHVKFFTHNPQIEELDVHPVSLRFLCEWINIFRVSVLRLISEDTYSRIFEQNTTSAEDVLKLFCASRSNGTTSHGINELPTFFNENTHKYSIEKCEPPSQIIKHQFQRKSQELDTVAGNKNRFGKDFDSKDDFPCVSKCTKHEKDGISPYEREDEELFQLNRVLPGSDVGDYEGMKMWEEGRMDYEGADKSENIIKRLQFLMQQS